MVVLEAVVVELGIVEEASEKEEQILTISVVIQNLREGEMVIMLKLVVTMMGSCLLPMNMTRTQSLWDKALLWKQDQRTLPEGL